MADSAAARTAVSAGVTGLVLTVLNQASAPALEPPLERASVLAGVLSVLLMLAGVLWERVLPPAAGRAELVGKQGLLLSNDLPNALRQELAWGSAMLLTATPAAVVLLQRGEQTLLRRGLLVDSPFRPGMICGQALQRQQAISLVDLCLYPGRDEFNSLLEGLPAVVVQPVGGDALLLVGGWSARCFNRGDLTWIEGWANKLAVGLGEPASFSGSLAAPELAAPELAAPELAAPEKD
jgi:hypothetical protein